MLITLHSYEAGTGKTLLSVNLGTIFCDMSKNAYLLDLDLRAPSLSSTFKNENKCWVNDYLSKSCQVENILTECTPDYIKSGKLFVGLSNPSTEAIREMSAKTENGKLKL